MTDDPIEERLSHEADLPEIDPEFGRRLLAITSRNVRSRRYRARLLQLAAVSVAFATGVLVTLPSRTPARPSDTSTLSNTPQSEGRDVDYTGAIDPGPALYADPEALAFAYDAADDAGKLTLLKEAGDYELNVNQDIRAALDYYRQWIVLADASTRQTYDETDTWLLASLKHIP